MQGIRPLEAVLCSDDKSREPFHRLLSSEILDVS